MKLIRACSLSLLFLSPLVATAAPVVFGGGVVSPASFVPNNLPQYGIAQGSIFTVFGSGMGPANIAYALSFPLQTSLAGTSIQITANGTVYNALMIFTVDSQIAAILPSSVPVVGNATLTVTYNGQVSNAVGFRVLQSAFGIFTVNQQGTGPAVLQNFVSSASQPFNNIITPAQPGQVEILWGTGLGPYNGDESRPPAPNLASPIGNNVQVLVGGQSASIQYNGRTPCCAGEDEIVFTVPQGVLGCYVPVQVIVNGVISNAGTMAISQDSNSTCAGQNTYLASLIPLLQSRSNVNIGSVRLMRVDQQTTQGGATAEIVTDQGRAGFANFTSQSILSSPELSGAYVTNGYCANYTFSGPDGRLGEQVRPNAPHDAGNTISISSPNGGSAKQLTPSGPGEYQGFLGASLGSPALYLSPGTFTAAGTGGANVGAFQASIGMPATPFSWTNQSSISNVPKGQPLQITWSGGAANSTVIINGFSTNTPNSAGAGFICAVNAGAGQFSVPVNNLGPLPGTQGKLIVSNRAAGFFQASGIDAGLGVITAEAEFDKIVSYGNPANPGSCNNPNLTSTQANFSGTATALSGTFPLACINGINTGTNLSGSPQVSLTGTTANNQTTYRGSITGSGTMTCSDGSPGNWNVNIPLTINVNPGVPSLATNGGTLSGSFNFNGPPTPVVNFCNTNQFLGIALFGSAAGSVLPGGNVVITLGGGGDSPVLLTGTAQSLTGVLPGRIFFDNSASGSVAINLTGSTSGQAAPSGQTSYTGGGTGGGTVSCQNITGSNTTSTWSGSLTVNSTIAPSVPSVAANGGGAVSGAGAFRLSLTFCGISDEESGVLTTTGTVTAGGAVTALIN